MTEQAVQSIGETLSGLVGGLGVDEFGRSHLLSVVLAMVFSTARALYMAALLFAMAALLVFLVEVRRVAVLGGLVQICVDSLESVPIYIWVLGSVSWAPDAGAVVAPLIFAIAGLPLIFNGLRGIVRQILHQPYCSAATALGAGEWHVFYRHVVPNTVPLAAPLFVHTMGAAMAVYGGIGVFGFVSRRELDLGILLLRGKEQAAFDITLLATGVGAYIVLYAGLQVLATCSSRLSGKMTSLVNRNARALRATQGRLKRNPRVLD